MICFMIRLSTASVHHCFGSPPLLFRTPPMHLNELIFIHSSNIMYSFLLSSFFLSQGFETVTIAYQGEVEHGDSVGNRGDHSQIHTDTHRYTQIRRYTQTHNRRSMRIPVCTTQHDSYCNMWECAVCVCVQG